MNQVYKYLFLILFIFSCMEKEGKDKHPEIPEFPITTNKNINIQLVIEGYNDFYYNDSFLVYKKNDTVTIHNIFKQTEIKMFSDVLIYVNGFFIIRKDNEFKALDDKNFKDYPLKIVDETKEYNRILDSIANCKNNFSEYENNKISDSLFVERFYKKYKLDPNLVPLAVYITGKDSYLKTETDEFVITNTPYSLDNVLHPSITQKKQTKINIIKNFKEVDKNKSKKSIFKNYDYAIMHKYWTSTSGRISIPYMREEGYYYYFSFNINNQKGNFKILSDHDNFTDLNEMINNYFLTSYNGSVYEVSLK